MIEILLFCGALSLVGLVGILVYVNNKDDDIDVCGKQSEMMLDAHENEQKE